MFPAIGYNAPTMNIGTLRTRTPFFLAPMAGYTNSSMRRVCVEHGAALVYTEMVVAMHLIRAPKDTKWLLKFEPSERPIIAQLAVADPESAARGTNIISDMGFDGVDLNLGCSVRRIAGGEMGSGLAKDFDRVREVLTAMVKATQLPVTAKFRSGPDGTNETAPALAKLCEECGAKAVGIHGRAAAQAYVGEADWSVIARTKAAVSIPVIGSGSVRTAQDAVRMLKETGCDGVMIARGAMGNPWIFKQAAQLLSSGTLPPNPTTAELRRVMLKHYELLVDEKGRRYANMLFRKQTSYYAKYSPHAKELRHAVHEAGNDDDVARIIRGIVA